jgi:hypothetical protein
MSKSIEKLAAALKRPFEPKEILTRKGSAGKDYQYIDARQVMKRLDEVVGLHNWQDKYTETESGRIICELSLSLDGNWITKSDGAGATEFAAEKGAISAAFKRAAVKFGIGRYLYNPDAFSNGVPSEWATPQGFDRRMSMNAQ